MEIILRRRRRKVNCKMNPHSEVLAGILYVHTFVKLHEQNRYKTRDSIRIEQQATLTSRQRSLKLARTVKQHCSAAPAGVFTEQLCSHNLAAHIGILARRRHESSDATRVNCDPHSTWQQKESRATSSRFFYLPDKSCFQTKDNG
jgi:hypothetical protein